MPGVPPNSPIYGLPRYDNATDPVDFAGQINAIIDLLDARAHPKPPLVTHLPVAGPFGSGPVIDGQECYLEADAANGVVWHLRYNAGSASAYKWEFLGGADLYSGVATNEAVASANVYQGLATAGPSVTLPVLPAGGDFDVTVGGLLGMNMSTGAGYTTQMSYEIGGAAPNDSDGVEFAFVGGGGPGIGASVARTRRKLAVAGGLVLLAQYKASVAPMPFANRFLQVRPVRVG